MPATVNHQSPYITQEELGVLRAVAERMQRLIDSGQLPPTSGLGPDADEARRRAAALAADRGHTAPTTVPAPSPSPSPSPSPALTEHVASGNGNGNGNVGEPPMLPPSVRAGWRSHEEWQRLQAELREARTAVLAERRELRQRDLDAFREERRQAGARMLLTESGFHLPNGRRVRLSEAMSTPEFPALLRAGLRTITFDSFSQIRSIWPMVAQSVESDKQAEVWLEMSRLGVLPVVPEGVGYPHVQTTLLPQRRVANSKYGEIIDVTWESVRFDQTNTVVQVARDRGAAAAQTLEDSFFSVMRTAGNYTKTSADNNIGNNTAATTFSPAGFLGAYETLTTMREARSGRYLNIQPDTLICGSRVFLPATQLLRSRTIQSGEDGASDAILAGVGDTNPFAGLGIRNILQSPYMGRDEWILGTAMRGVVYQEVDPLTLVDQTANDDEGSFTADVWRYKVRLYFGFGLYDDRFWYYSSSTTAPTWA